MSRKRHVGDGAILVATGQMRFGLHWHEENQLAWASSGILTVSSREGTWVLPTSRALWIPGGTEHVTEVGPKATFCCPYFARERGPRHEAPAVVAITPLARELILHLTREPPGSSARGRAETVLLDQLVPVPVSTISVPMPKDPRARDVADAVVADPADDATVAIWARRAGASERTLTRIFPRETGMTFGQWRTRVRLRAALPLLAEGMTVSATARKVGYTTPSAFVAVFRKVTGESPGAYFTSR